MKSIYRAMMAGLLLLGLASQANANLIVDGGPYDGTDVGSLDSLVDSITKAAFKAAYGPGGGEQNELDWINDATGESFMSLSKVEDVPWYHVTDTNDAANTNIIGFRLATGLGYYLIKNASDLRVLFSNNLDYLWGVVDLTSLGGLSALNLGDDMEISHVSGAGEPTTKVSEPGILSLLGLGLGLLAFGLSRRRQGSTATRAAA